MLKFIFIVTILSVATHINSEGVTKDTTKTELTVLQDKFLKECKEEFKVSDDEMRAFLDSDASMTPANKLKCMLACYGGKIGFVKDTKVDWELLHVERKVHHGEEEYQKKMSPVVEHCKATVKDGQEKCELSYLLARCLQEGFKKAMTQKS